MLQGYPPASNLCNCDFVASEPVLTYSLYRYSIDVCAARFRLIKQLGSVFSPDLSESTFFDGPITPVALIT